MSNTIFSWGLVGISPRQRLMKHRKQKAGKKNCCKNDKYYSEIGFQRHRMNSFSEAQSFCTQNPSGTDKAIASFIVPGSMVNGRKTVFRM